MSQSQVYRTGAANPAGRAAQAKDIHWFLYGKPNQDAVNSATRRHRRGDKHNRVATIQSSSLSLSSTVLNQKNKYNNNNNINKLDKDSKAASNQQQTNNINNINNR